MFSQYTRDTNAAILAITNKHNKHLYKIGANTFCGYTRIWSDKCKKTPIWDITQIRIYQPYGVVMIDVFKSTVKISQTAASQLIS
jgi:hypothetical protein